MNALQEEITQKTLALCVEASKMTAQLLQQAMKKVLADMEKHKKNPQLRHGKQTLRQLMKHNTGVSNIEITDQNIRAFSSTAKKYGLDFALKKDTSGELPRYLVFFKGRDADVITAAFREFSAKNLSREKDPSIRRKLEKAQEQSKTQHMFIGLVRKYTRARKLTPRMLNELIEKIEVFNAEKIDGVWEQRLRIHYNCVGTIEIPTVLPLPIPEVSVNTRKGVVVNYAPCELAV